MGERETLLASIASTIQTYRKGELPEPNAAHVDKWVSQFTPENQLAFLREFNHVIKSQFVTEEHVNDFLGMIVEHPKLTRDNPKEFWLKANILDIQKKGQSQTSMALLLDKQLQIKLGIKLSECGHESGDFIYLDDVIFSGGRIRTDLTDWIKETAPAKANIYVIVIAWHRLGQFQTEGAINQVIKESGKAIKVTYWRSFEIENRRRYRNSSEVLWPTEIPLVKEVQEYMALAQKFPFEARISASGGIAPFSSEAGRHVLEQEFLIAGAKIRSQGGQIADVNRPLGHGYFGLGFGATVTTYRNCPNNCPLAIWWGDPNAKSGALKWYPLLLRKNYSSVENVFAKLFK